LDPVDCEFVPAHSSSTTTWIDGVPITNHQYTPDKWYLYYGVRLDNGQSSVRRVEVDKSRYDAFLKQQYNSNIMSRIRRLICLK